MKTVMPVRRLWMVLGGIVVSLLGSCSSTLTRPAARLAPVRSVDFRGTPEMKDLAERARELGNTVYPKVCALLADRPRRRGCRGIPGPMNCRKVATAHFDSGRMSMSVFLVVLYFCPLTANSSTKRTRALNPRPLFTALPWTTKGTAYLRPATITGPPG
jgi:hypothetical protein